MKTLLPWKKDYKQTPQYKLNKKSDKKAWDVFVGNRYLQCRFSNNYEKAVALRRQWF